ncbi:MAG: hypothetical protein SFT68_02600, partial [Rickettsiaceae bacterium]|nr:hypothetical protein [Rickettsiaceae bacterium]
LILMAEEKTGSKASECGKNYLIFNKYIPAQEIIRKIDAVETNNLTKVAKNIFSSSPILSVVSGIKTEIPLETLNIKA